MSVGKFPFYVKMLFKTYTSLVFEKTDWLSKSFLKTQNKTKNHHILTKTRDVFNCSIKAV